MRGSLLRGDGVVRITLSSTADVGIGSSHNEELLAEGGLATETANCTIKNGPTLGRMGPSCKQSEASGASAADQSSLTSILPVLRPSNSPMKACGILVSP